MRKGKEQSYTHLSEIYDEIVQSNELLDAYVDFVRNNFENDIKILDVACGTGSLIKELSKYYREVEGLDRSEDMVSLARSKTDRKIYNEDAVNFNLNKKYDVILSTYDSLNYVLSEDELKAAFF